MKKDSKNQISNHTTNFHDAQTVASNHFQETNEIFSSWNHIISSTNYFTPLLPDISNLVSWGRKMLETGKELYGNSMTPEEIEKYRQAYLEYYDLINTIASKIVENGIQYEMEVSKNPRSKKMLEQVIQNLQVILEEIANLPLAKEK